MTAFPPVKPCRPKSQTRPRSVALAGALFLAAAARSACGGGGNSATHGDPALPPGAAEISPGLYVAFADRPTCASVWVIGKKLPIDYNGCLDGDKWVNDTLGSCNDEGPADVTTYDNRLWGRLGQPIRESVTPEVWDDPGYVKAMGCR